MPSCSEAPRRFSITTSTGSYDVVIGAGLFAALVEQQADRVFIVDACVADAVRAGGINPIVIVADELAKSLDRMTEIVVQLRDRGATRGATLVAIGGGVVQDIAAFVASIYMRGLDWIYFPTTLLSMADSCIGGKSSINVGKYKNIAGTIHPPVEVCIDPRFISTLSEEQKAAGLCEAAKICLARGLTVYEDYDALAPSAKASGDELVPVIAVSLEAKKYFIEKDEFDRAERLLLNFGHTFGHALEAATDFAVNHGIAVGLGMLTALEIGGIMGRDYRAIPQIARFRADIAALVASVANLPQALRHATADRLIDAFASDKKHRADAFAMILVNDKGALERTFVPRDRQSETMIVRAYDRLLASHRAVA